MAEPPRSTHALENLETAETICLNCGYDLNGLESSKQTSCPECAWPQDRKPSLWRPVGTTLLAVVLLTLSSILFLYNSIVIGVMNSYHPGSYPQQYHLLWFPCALLLWFTAIATSVAAPKTNHRLCNRPEARNTTIGLGIVISFVLPVLIVGGLLAMAL
ncbi:MAG: hypothetical protein ACIAQF_13650 [Phycisphaerales bacterium JB065]